MINKEFWKTIAENWALDDDGIEIIDDRDEEAEKAKQINDDDLAFMDGISNDEIDDILSDLGLDDIF